MKLPEREYFTLLELSQKWECSQNDVFHLIETGRLIPSIFVNGAFDEFLLEDDDEGGLGIPSHGMGFV